ncbi:hypothetical protein FIU95_17695 [Microbulbifer sp. THAF38]|nr:hypothetical protein FIU95_17695 [Microbulbifer sp. THAF38]
MLGPVEDGAFSNQSLAVPVYALAFPHCWAVVKLSVKSSAGRLSNHFNVLSKLDTPVQVQLLLSCFQLVFQSGLLGALKISTLLVIAAVGRVFLFNCGEARSCKREFYA